MQPNFSAYPWTRLRKLSRRDAQLESMLARWIGARSRGERLGRLVGVRGVAGRGEVGAAAGRGTRLDQVRVVRVEVVERSVSFDRFAARCEVRASGAGIEVRGSSLGVRAIAQHLLGGPEELAAARPLTIVERSIWALVVATALEDLGVAGEVWPQLDDQLVDDVSPSSEDKTRVGRPTKLDRPKQPGPNAEVSRMQDSFAPPIVELAVVLGEIALAVQIHAPADLLLRDRASSGRAWPAWFATTYVDIPIVVGRCALERGDLDLLAVRSLVTLDRPVGAAPTRTPSRALAVELDVLGGSLGLTAHAGALEARVATEYVPRDMSLPDDAHVELTVALGTTKLSLREISELAIGQIIQLGRPLAGPFELRAAGRVIGRGELVDVDGELAVRIVSLGE